MPNFYDGSSQGTSILDSVSISEEELKQVSETSTNRDVSMVINHSILSEEDYLIDLKNNKNMSSFEEIKLSEQHKNTPILQRTYS